MNKHENSQFFGENDKIIQILIQRSFISKVPNGIFWLVLMNEFFAEIIAYLYLSPIWNHFLQFFKIKTHKNPKILNVLDQKLKSNVNLGSQSEFR